MIETVFNKNKNELNKITVNIIANSIKRLLKEQDHVVLGIPGGRSVIGLFSLLKNAAIPWNKVHIFMVDERLVALDDPSSNFKLANDIFIKHLIYIDQLPEENVHPFIMAEEKEDFGMQDYESALKALGGDYDIILLSSGEEGHVASLFLYHHSIKDITDYFVIMHDSLKPPRDRITISRNLLLCSKVGIVLFIDESKREAYKNFKNQKLTFQSCPAKLVLSLKTSYVITNLD